MKPSFFLLAAADLGLLSLTAVMGFLVRGVEGFHQHFLLGVMSGLYTCFVHIVVFVYFIVQDKIIKQSILHDGLANSFAGRIEELKSRVLRLSMMGILSIGLTIALGAAIDIYLGSAAHMIAAFAALFINLMIFVLQYDVLDRYSILFREAFQE